MCAGVITAICIYVQVNFNNSSDLSANIKAMYCMLDSDDSGNRHVCVHACIRVCIFSLTFFFLLSQHRRYLLRGICHRTSEIDTHE